jgi:hypothetical protein
MKWFLTAALNIIRATRNFSLVLAELRQLLFISIKIPHLASTLRGRVFNGI